MRRELGAYLWDIDRAVGEIEEFLRGKQFSDYQRDAMLRAAVERKFEIIGEALAQARRQFPEIVGRIAHDEQIIAFRNRLIHGYSLVKDELVWDVIQTDLPLLRQQAADLLQQWENGSLS